jgi:Brp/Blh family beta-carotene 15,15'-monooxygenase
MTGFTYLQFYVAFLVTAVLALIPIAAVFRSRACGRTVWPLGGGRYWSVVAVVTAVALLYTTPWDNYLIAAGVWGYGEGRVAATVWHAPVGEYLFILTQPVLTGLWLSQLTVPERWPEADGLRRRPRIAAGTLGLAVGAVGGALLTGAGTGTFYLGAILLWAAPVLALQWVVGAPQLRAARRTVALGVLVPTVYLCAADRIALELGVWRLADRYTTGVAPAGLPLEEAAFFLLTNLFVVQGLVLYRWLADRGGPGAPWRWLGSRLRANAAGRLERAVARRRTRAVRPIGPAAVLVTGVVAALAGDLPRAVRYGPLLLSVAAVGLPHGAVDHVAAARATGGQGSAGGDNAARTRPAAGFDGRAALWVASVYAVGGGGYLLLWVAAPVAAAGLFLLLTWFHWGQGDLYHLLATGRGAHLDRPSRRALALAVRGGVPMVVPLLSFPDLYRRIVAALAGVFGAPAVPAWPFGLRIRLVLGAGFAALTLAALAWGRIGAETADERAAWRADAGETSLLWGFFLLTPPVLAIGVYFALWHSLRHVRRLLALGTCGAGPEGPTDPRAPESRIAALDRCALGNFAREALPNTVGALVLLAGVYAVTAPGGLLAVAAGYLVVLAVLTFPHTLVVTWLDARQGVWTVRPT